MRVPIAYVVGTTFSRGVGVAIGTQLSNINPSTYLTIPRFAAG